MEAMVVDGIDAAEEIIVRSGHQKKSPVLDDQEVTGSIPYKMLYWLYSALLKQAQEIFIHRGSKATELQIDRSPIQTQIRSPLKIVWDSI
jgi:hypothetical protein